MAFEAFVNIDGIDGESTDDLHPDWIEVITYETNLDQKISTTASSSGGATAERANFKPFIFSKLLDRTTPKLSLACAQGTHIDTIIMELCRAGGDKLKYMAYKLTNCIISRIITGGGPGEFPADIVFVDFGKIEWRYTLQKRAGGGAAGQIAAGWNLQKNCRV